MPAFIALFGLLLLQTPAAHPAAGMISGRVAFNDGAPAAGTLVTAVLVGGAGRPLLARVDDSGNYRLPNIPPGRYYVRSGFGFNEGPFTYYPDATTESSATVVIITSETNAGITFNLSPAASGVRVAGHVTFPPNQRGRDGTEKVVMGPTSGVYRPTGVIAADGTFEIRHVMPGRYTLIVDPAPGMQPQPFVVPESELTGIELSVPRLFPVTGTVTTDPGRARPRFAVAFESPGYRTTVPVAAEGTFTSQLPEGDYRLVVNGLPGGFYLKSLAAGESDLIASPLKIKVSANQSAPIKITFGVSAGVKVTGRVVVSGSDPSAASFRGLVLAGRAVTEIVESPLGLDGSFELAKAMPGEYFARTTLASGLMAPPVPVTIPNKEVRDLEIAIPPEVVVFGRIAVDGNGPSPKFSLLLVRGSGLKLSEAKPGALPTVESNALTSLTRSLGDATQVVQMAVNALPDGSFKMKLPEGVYRIAVPPAPNGIPPAYVLRSLTYGSADLLKEPMTITSDKSSELQIGFGTAAPNPWVKVRGRVLGADPTQGPFHVGLGSRTTATIEAIVNQDGSFEFPAVLQDNAYTAGIVPANDAASSPNVRVTDKDVTGVQITVPSEKEVRILTDVEGGGPIPGFVMSLAGTNSVVNVVVKPERGAFVAKLPMDERQVKISGLPIGYMAKAAIYGSTDVLKQPLKISKDDLQELQVALTVDPAVLFGSVHGRVIGLQADRNDVRLLLNGTSAFSTFETNVALDGSFSISKIPQGAYVPTLLGAGVSGLLSPASIVVTGSDLSDVEITVPKPDSRPVRPLSDDGPTGVVVSAVGAGSREAANESAAVAQLRTINTALVTYLAANGGKYGSLPQLIQAGLLDQRFGSPISGFTYSIIAVGTEYAAAAIPTSQGTARYGYYATSDAVIRYSTLEMLAPPNQGGRPVQ